METSDYAMIVIAAFFGLVLYSTHLDEKRKGDRRRVDLPFPTERRKGRRREGSLIAYVAWILRALGARLKG